MYVIQSMKSFLGTKRPDHRTVIKLRLDKRGC